MSFATLDNKVGWSLIAVALGVAGCGNGINAPNGAIAIRGLLVIDNIVVPNAATVGQAVAVTVGTGSRDSCVRLGPTRVSMVSGRVLVEPFDFDFSRSGVGCLTVVTILTHTVDVVFDTPGVTTVVVRGIDADGEQIDVERAVTVTQ